MRKPENVKFVLYASFALVVLIVGCVFASDWFFAKTTKEAGFLDGILVGVFVKAALDWIKSIIDYYFPSGSSDTADAMAEGNGQK